MAPDSAYLLRLPPPVQAPLVEVARAVAGMDQKDRVQVLECFTGVATAFLAHDPLMHRPALELMGALGDLVQAIDEQAYPRDEEKV